VREACGTGAGEVVPVDSEHSAILQCITGHPAAQVRRVVLTASGGPFREWSAERLASATVRMRFDTRRGGWGGRSQSTARPWRTRLWR
jgi:1-deoxy-D-xylulose 5-phosphate reductoisomerase